MGDVPRHGADKGLADFLDRIAASLAAGKGYALDDAAPEGKGHESCLMGAL
jgi:hypothetical protein